MKKFLKKTSLFLVTAAMTVSAPLMAWALEHDIVILHKLNLRNLISSFSHYRRPTEDAYFFNSYNLFIHKGE